MSRITLLWCQGFDPAIDGTSEERMFPILVYAESIFTHLVPRIGDPIGNYKNTVS